jgi:hypothetical protein
MRKELGESETSWGCCGRRSAADEVSAPLEALAQVEDDAQAEQRATPLALQADYLRTLVDEGDVLAPSTALTSSLPMCYGFMRVHVRSSLAICRGTYH